MKEERALQEGIRLLEKEIQTLTSELQRIRRAVSRLEDLEVEIKSIKIYLGRVYPDFKKELPEIIRRIKPNKPSK